MTSTEQINTNTSVQIDDEIESDSFAPDLSGTPDMTRLVIATFNIRYAVGSFLISGSLLRRVGLSRPRRRPALIARHIARAARAFTDAQLMPRADIIALQEADRETLRAGGWHVARELARALKMDFARAALKIPRGEEPKSKQWYLDFEERIGIDETGETGVAILSRLPLASVARVELPFTECAWRPRLALAATLKVGAQPLHIFNSHIDPHASVEEQLAQHEAILAQAARAGENAPVVLLGDFNTLTPNARARMRCLLEARGYTTPLPTSTATWRAGLIRLHTDWIFTRGVQVIRWGVARPLGVSDHWPIWIEIELNSHQGAHAS